MSWNHGQNRPNNGAVLKLQVDIGKCKKVGKNVGKVEGADVLKVAQTKK